MLLTQSADPRSPYIYINYVINKNVKKDKLRYPYSYIRLRVFH